MEIIGLDLHKRESQLSIKADNGSITDRRIATSRERFTAEFGERPRARILLEEEHRCAWCRRRSTPTALQHMPRFLVTSAPSRLGGEYDDALLKQRYDICTRT